MIDTDGGGTLSKAEIVDAVKNNDEVIKFLDSKAFSQSNDLSNAT